MTGQQMCVCTYATCIAFSDFLPGYAGRKWEETRELSCQSEECSRREMASECTVRSYDLQDMHCTRLDLEGEIRSLDWERDVYWNVLFACYGAREDLEADPLTTTAWECDCSGRRFSAIVGGDGEEKRGKNPVNWSKHAKGWRTMDLATLFRFLCWSVKSCKIEKVKAAQKHV